MRDSHRVPHGGAPVTHSARHPWPLAWLALAFAAICAARAWLVNAQLAAVAGCSYCLLLPSLGHDAWLLAPAWAWLGIAAGVRSAPLRVFMLVPLLLALLALVADVAILATLGLRLYLFDVFKFGGEGAAIADFVAALWRSSGGIAVSVVVVGLVTSLSALWPRRRSPSLAFALLGMAGAAAVGVLFAGRLETPYVLGESALNLAELHQAQSVDRPYSHEFVQKLAERHTDAPLQCAAGLDRRPDVLVIAIESLSSYHSGLLGGPFDDLPRLDDFARRHTWFESFHANGFTTDHGLIALLTGQPPLPAPGRYSSLDVFRGFGEGEHSLPRAMQSAGYETAFFTTGDLGFLDKVPWLRSLGFDRQEGSESAFYAGWPRHAFNAAEDAALYLRLAQWMRTRDDTRPFFAFALTVQSHPPFVDPATRRLDEHAVMRNVDAALAGFLERLEAEGFFERGIVMVTGDHRSMTPLHREEFQRHGERAFARVPLIVAGRVDTPKGRIAAPFQQTDLLPSLRDLTGRESCTQAGQGRFLRADPRPPAWVLHVRGDRRNRIDAYFGATSASLVLDGDDSRWVGARPPQWRTVQDAVHRDRVRRGVVQTDVKALLELMGR